MDTNRRWVVIGFVAIGVVIAWVSGQGFNYLFHVLKKYNNNIRDFELLGSAFKLSHFLGVLGTCIAAWVLWKNEEINVASHEVVEELRKVTWPEKEDVQNSTVVVIISTVIFAFVFFAFDWLWKWATGVIYS